jgi:hypothetical protein
LNRSEASIAQWRLHLHSLRNHFMSEVYTEDLIPPANFTLVSRGVFRSAFPKKKNFAFLRRLGLKSVL